MTHRVRNCSKAGCVQPQAIQHRSGGAALGGCGHIFRVGSKDVVGTRIEAIGHRRQQGALRLGAQLGNGLRSFAAGQCLRGDVLLAHVHFFVRRSRKPNRLRGF